MKESQHIEWKASWRDEYLKWICGFANADGGVLVIGRNDKGVAVGVKNARKLLGKNPSRPFNPLIANAFFRAGYIESWGRGIEKIHRECRKHGIQQPAYDFDMAGLMLTFQANPAHLHAAASEQGRTTLETTPITTPIATRNQLVSLILAKPVGVGSALDSPCLKCVASAAFQPFLKGRS